jgi:formylmethanofuran dehydrogenase subunit E
MTVQHNDGPVTINTVTATRVSAGDREPEEYASASRDFIEGIEETRPPSDASARERKRAAETYAAWFLDRTELLSVPRERVNLFVDRKAKTRRGVCHFDNYMSDDPLAERKVRIGLTEDFLMGERVRASWKSVCETVRHELVHAHLYFQDVPPVHTPRFRWLSRAHNVNRLDRYENEREPRFVLGCKECDKWSWRKNRSKHIRMALDHTRVCGNCGEYAITARELTERERSACVGPQSGGPPGIVEPDEPDEPPITDPEVTGAAADAPVGACSACGERTGVDVREYGGEVIEWCEGCGSPR